MVYFKREKQKQHLSDIYQNTIDLIGENKNPLKTDQFFRGDQYFSPTNNFTRIKLTPTKNFYPGLQETCGLKKFFF